MAEAKLSTNCLEGFLTVECVTCPFWKNEKDCTGCAYPGPIDHCDAFHEMWVNDPRNRSYYEQKEKEEN